MSPSFILFLLRKYQKKVAFVLILTLAVFLGAAFVLPKKYKSYGLLGIQTDYFRYPLIEDFVPPISDQSELASRRDALIREALSDEFIEKVGRDLGLIKSSEGSPDAALEREYVRKRFEYYPLSLTTVQIVFSGPQADSAQRTVNQTMDHIQSVFAQHRVQKILRARDNIQLQLESMNLQQDPASSLGAVSRPELLEAEIERIEKEIAVMKSRLSSRHPTVLELEQRAEILRRNLVQARSSQGKITQSKMPKLVGETSQKAVNELYESLIKKLAYLNIALDFESEKGSGYVSVLQPATYPMGISWPNKRLFAIWGLLVGMLLSGVLVLISETLRVAPSKGEELAKDLDLPLLGEIPILKFEIPASFQGELVKKYEDPATRS